MAVTPVDQDLIDKLPRFDAYCATVGDGTDLNAIVTGGATRIALGPGAVLTANLALTASDGFIWTPFGMRGLNLGAYRITCSGNDWNFEGFELNGMTGAGIEFTGISQTCTLTRVTIRNGSSHGVQFNSSGNDHQVLGCYIESNGGDGIKIQAGSGANRIYGNFIWGNTGWGINDLSDDIIEGCNRLDNNTGGARNTSSTFVNGVSKTT